MSYCKIYGEEVVVSRALTITDISYQFYCKKVFNNLPDEIEISTKEARYILLSAAEEANQKTTDIDRLLAIALTALLNCKIDAWKKEHPCRKRHILLRNGKMTIADEYTGTMNETLDYIKSHRFEHTDFEIVDPVQHISAFGE